MNRKEYNYWLSNIKNIGIKKIDRLLQGFGCAEEIFRAKEEELMKFQAQFFNQTQLSEGDIYELVKSRKPEEIIRNYAKLAKGGIYFVSKEDNEYPDKLRNIYNGPYSLYIKGKLPGKNQKIVAIVGARDCSHYGREIAKQISYELSKEGIAIVSGLARGIDTYAHMGAIEARGTTYGVLGSGIDVCYPKENINLYHEMQREGAIISEYAPTTQPFSSNFPMRNRIISGLSDGVLVIEAREKSGSLITVDLGLEQGKDIFAVPGKVTDRLSGGCNNLIKMGAKLVTSSVDILEELLPNYQQIPNDLKKNNKILERDGKIVYACLSFEPMHIEEISVKSGVALDVLMEQLVLLELGGFVTQIRKNYYIVKNR